MLSYFLPLVLIVLWATKAFIPRVRVRTYKSAAQIRRLLNPPNTSLGDILSARATPNQRLVHAFGINSTFVSGDPKIHKAFTASARALIGAGDSGTWHTLALGAESTTNRFLPNPHDATAFSTLIRCITFSVILSTLFHTNLDTIRYEDVALVTDIINERWTESKVKDDAEMRQDQGSLRILLAHIDQWVVDRDRYPNPLNFILPAYETMWRVVAVTVAYVYRCRDNTLHNAVVAFGNNLTEESFQTFGEGQPSMQAIVLEVLRLHPPTRHIVRASSGTQLVGGTWWWRMLGVPMTEVADVEGVHLSDEYGKNTSVFDPMRFHPSRMRERPELYSFGHGRLKCVASNWAPMAAAVIAAMIVTQIDETGCKVMVGPKIGGRSGWDGWLVRREGE